jgi:hypothetical protein
MKNLTSTVEDDRTLVDWPDQMFHIAVQATSRLDAAAGPHVPERSIEECFQISTCARNHYSAYRVVSFKVGKRVNVKREGCRSYGLQYLKWKNWLGAAADAGRVEGI